MHRFDRCTTRGEPSSLVAPVWLHFSFEASLKVIQPLPVWASVRIIRLYSWRAGTCFSNRPCSSAARYALLEVLAVQVGEMRDLLRVEQRPLPVLLDALHEEVGDPVGDVQVVRATGVVAGVVAQFEEVLDVGVPRLEVHARGTLASTTLVDRGDRRVERAQPRHDAVREAVGAR